LREDLAGRGHLKDFSSHIHEYNMPMTYSIYTVSTNPGTSDSRFYSLNANYEYKIDNLGSNIQALLYYESQENESEDISEEYLADANWIKTDSLIEGFKTLQTERGPQLRARIDYTKKYKDRRRIEAGLQARLRPEFHVYSYEERQADIGWVELPEYGSDLNFIRDIYSSYATYSGEYKTWGYQVGLRGEYTYRNVYDDSRDYSFKINRFDFFPTLHFSKKFKHEQQMLLSYSRRIDRPGGWELEPFTRYISSNFKRRGNPELQPEYTNNVELSYQKSIKKSFVSIEAYNRATSNVVSRVQSMDSMGVITMSFENLDRDIATGFELMLNLRLVKWMDINISGNYYRYQVLGSSESLGDVDNVSNNFDMRGNLLFSFSKDTRLQVNGYFRGASVTAQGNRQPFFVTSLSLRQNFFKRKLSVSLNVRDVFRTSIWEFSIIGDGFTNHVRFNPVSPTITLNLSYKINNYKEKRSNGGGFEGGGGDGIL
jgi:outer membrane receptor protein involved in Fe transport